MTLKLADLLEYLNNNEQVLWCNYDNELVPVHYRDIFSIQTADHGLEVATAAQIPIIQINKLFTTCAVKLAHKLFAATAISVKNIPIAVQAITRKIALYHAALPSDDR